MSKPLKLTIHPRLEDTNLSPEDIRQGRWTELRLGRRKRLTDTELAAEVFRQAAWLGAVKRTYATDEGRNVVIEAAFTFGPITRDEHEWLTVNRFATLPHYDEETA